VSCTFGTGGRRAVRGATKNVHRADHVSCGQNGDATLQPSPNHEKDSTMIKNGMFVIFGMELSFMHVFFFSLALIVVGGVCTLFRGHTLIRVFALTFGYGLGLCGVCLMCLAVYLLFVVHVTNKTNDTKGAGRVENNATVLMRSYLRDSSPGSQP